MITSLIISLIFTRPNYYVHGLLRNILVKLVKFLFCFLIATIFGE